MFLSEFVGREKEPLVGMIVAEEELEKGSRKIQWLMDGLRLYGWDCQ